MTPSNNPAQWPSLSPPTNGFAAILLQFLDATGGVIMTYVSEPFTETNYNVGVWTQLSVVGAAPYNAVSGRTMCAVLGDDTNFSGVVYFDDISQSVVSTGQIEEWCGLLQNPGFDCGPPGNAYELYTNGLFLGWEWLGSTNLGDEGSGFVADSHYKSNSGPQSLAITWPENLAGQGFEAATGMEYVLRGYIFNPSSTAEVFEGDAYGTLVMEFWNGTDLVSAVMTEPFTSASTNDEWLEFAVTNHAPWSDFGGALTGRVLVGTLGSSSNYHGVLYFDDLCLETDVCGKTNTQSGALWNPGFEYTAWGTVLKYVDNWEAFGEAGVVDGEVAHEWFCGDFVTVSDELQCGGVDAVVGGWGGAKGRGIGAYHVCGAGG